jgi:rubrerythrin
MFVFGTADDVFGMAVRIEENGYAFYAGIAEGAEDRELKRLFEDLAGMEKGHITLFKALRSDLAASLAESVWDPEGLAQSYLQLTADTHVFTVEAASDRLKRIKTPDQALDVALQFEKDSVAFFLGMKELLPDPAGKGEIDKLILSEMDHIRMLSLAKKSLAETGTAKIS